MKRPHTAFLVLIGLVAIGGCSKASSTIPTAPTVIGSTVLLASPTVTSIRAWVVDTASRPLPGARVDVLDGISAGTTGVTDDTGQVLLGGTFDKTTRFRVVKDGHESRTQPWSCSVEECPGARNAQPWLLFSLTPSEPAVNIAGQYTLTFIADRACAANLPEFARNRSYRVVVAAQPAGDRSTIPSFAVTIDGGAFVQSLNGFPIGVAGNYLGFGLHGRHDPPIVEDLGGNEYLAFSGGGHVTVDPANLTTITTDFDGWIYYLALRAPMVSPYYELVPTASCDSSRHRVTLTRAN